MKKINEIESVKILEANFFKAFKSKDPFDDCFAADIQTRFLLFPTEGYYLQEEQFNVLCQAISHLGENEFFISEIEGDCFSRPLSSDSYEHGHWKGNISSDYEEYTDIPIVIENAIYSTSGTWGVIISHEGHAVLGGSKELIKQIQNAYPNFKSCKQRFIEYWENTNSNIKWVHDFLKQFP